MIKHLSFTLAVMVAASFSIVSAQQTGKITASGIGYLEYLPEGYHSNSKKYPVVISLHGIKEKGTSSNDRKRVLADLQKVDNVGLPKYVKQGKDYPFILISPQLKSNRGVWPASYVMEVINYVKKDLRVDEDRIYLTGLSLGGFGVWRTAGDYPHVFAAIAPVCSGGNVLSKADRIAKADLPIWGFHGNRDHVVSHNVTVKMINAVNKHKPNPLAKTTIFNGMGHSIWDRAYNETNLLNWLLSHRRGSSHGDRDDDGDDDDDDRDEDGKNDNDGDNDSDGGDRGGNANKPPVARAGSDRTLMLPDDEITLRGTGSDADGKIASYKWTKIRGGRVTLRGTDDAELRASDLREGNYVFRLTVKDNDGATRSDDMLLRVRKSKESKDSKEDNKDNNKNDGNDNKKDDNKPSKNKLPYAYAGADRFVTLPDDEVTIHAKASDRDGRIVSYEWTQTYGRRVSLSGTHSDAVRIYNLEKGKFIFRLRVTDDDGGVKDDYFKITVNGSSGNGKNDNESRDNDNQGRQNDNSAADRNTNEQTNRNNEIPRAWAGPDRVIELPVNAVEIQGKASDKDGRVVSYQWAQTYGDRVGMSGENSSRVRIYNLEKGVYIFRLRVRDNDDGIRDDYFKITVKGSGRGKDVSSNTGGRRENNPARDASRNERPEAYAGPDLRVRLSNGSVHLVGSGRDSDGRIVSYQWKVIAGPGDLTIRNRKSPTPTLTDLEKGRYYISLTVKDDDNATHVDKMALRVTGS